MSNHLTTEKKTAAVSMLCEGNSIRSIERMTGVHRDTIMRLGVRMGAGCQKIMHEKFRALDCKVKSIRCTPAMAAGVVNSPWTVGNLVEMIEG